MLSTAAPSLADSPRKLPWWGSLLLALCALAVYANTLKNGFALDDVAIVQTNPHVQQLHWAEIWSDNYWPKMDGVAPDVLYRPLTIWTYLVNQWLTPDAPWSFHLFNILAHALVTMMVAALAWRLLGCRAVAVVAGLLFALHPLHTEAVANTVGRAEILAALFSLAALLVYLPDRGVMTDHDLPLPHRPWWHGLIVAACFFAAMLCKETPVTLLGAFVFIDLWLWTRAAPARRPTLFRWFARQSFRYYLPLAASFGTYLLMRIHACGLITATNTHPVVNPLITATVPQRLITPFALFAKYLQLTCWPRILSADYSAPSLMPTANPLQPLALVGILVSALILIAFIRWWKAPRPRPQLVLVLGLFIFAYGLIANLFVRIGTIFGERLFYWPSVFLFILAAYAAVALYRAASTFACRRPLRLACGLVAAALALAMTLRTITRNTDWEGNVPLSIASARDNLQSSKACYWAGMVMVTQGSQPWMEDFGAGLLQRAVKLYPGFGDSYFELAKYYGRKKQFGKSLFLLAKAAQNEPGAQAMRFAVASVESQMAAQDPAQYMPELEAEIALHPGDPAGDFVLALAYTAQKKDDLALAACKRVLMADPHFHEAGAQLAFVHHQAGDDEAAVATLRTYVRNVGYAFDARCTLAQYLLELDASRHPTALQEAAMNLDRAARLGDLPALRKLQAELHRRQAALAAPAPAPSLALKPAEDRP